MSSSFSAFLPKTYCPLLITPDFTLSDKDFVPFEQYLGGCFLFHLDQEYVVMDTLGREIQRVRAQSASLEQADDPIPIYSSSHYTVTQPMINIFLRYTCNGVENTVIVHTFMAPSKPPKPKTLEDMGYSLVMKIPSLSIGCWGLKNPKGRLIIPKNYLFLFGSFDQDGKGFIFACGEKGYAYFDQDGERLIPFIRKEDGSTHVCCTPLKDAKLFENGLALAELHGAYGSEKIIMDTTGHCLGNRTWYDIGPVCGDLIPVREHKDNRWTLMNRAGDLLWKDGYTEVFPTPNGTVFCVLRHTNQVLIVPKEEVHSFFRVPSSTDDGVQLFWQEMKEAEPGLLWAWRDGRHELIDCRKNRTDFLALYDQPIAKTRDVCWEAHEEYNGLYVLTAPNEHICMTQDEFRQYIDYLERTCGMHRCFSATLPGGSCLLGFEGSRTHAPFHVQSEHASKTVSLLIDYRKAEDGFDVRLIAAGKPYPSIPPMPKNTYERIYLTEETYQACRKYMRKGTIHTSFCDPNEAAPPKPEPYPPDPEGDWDCRI